MTKRTQNSMWLDAKNFYSSLFVKSECVWYTVNFGEIHAEALETAHPSFAESQNNIDRSKVKCGRARSCSSAGVNPAPEGRPTTG